MDNHCCNVSQLLLLKTVSGLWFKEEEDEQRPFKRRRLEIRGGHFAF
jgi:hypothetical protein